MTHPVLYWCSLHDNEDKYCILCQNIYWIILLKEEEGGGGEGEGRDKQETLMGGRGQGEGKNHIFLSR